MATKDTLNVRVTRLETEMALLVKTVRKLRIESNEREKRMDKRFDAMNAQIFQLHIESDKREKRMDERIGSLVSAIGEFIRHRNGKT